MCLWSTCILNANVLFIFLEILYSNILLQIPFSAVKIGYEDNLVSKMCTLLDKAKQSKSHFKYHECIILAWMILFRTKTQVIIIGKWHVIVVHVSYYDYWLQNTTVMYKKALLEHVQKWYPKQYPCPQNCPGKEMFTFQQHVHIFKI